MTFPFVWNRRGLAPHDFARLSWSLPKTFNAHLPCREVHCFGVGTDSSLIPACPPEWVIEVGRVIKKKRPRTATGGTVLFLPLWNEEELVGVAVVRTDDEAGTFHRHSHAALQEASRRISRELALLQDWATEPVTGLLNGRCFHEELCLLTGEADNGAGRAAVPFLLVLLDVFPEHRDAEQGLHYIAKAAGYLEALVGHYSPLYHFGAGVFAMLWRDADLEKAMPQAEAVLRWLKREEFGPVRIGIADCGVNSGTESDFPVDPQGCGAETMLDQAWQALRRARTRGAYALCTYASLVDPRLRQLTAVDPAVLQQLQHLWQGCFRFTLALLRRDGEQPETSPASRFSKKVLALAGQGVRVVPVSGHEAFVLLDGADPDVVRAWATNFQRLAQEATGATFSVGLACHPCPGFRKMDMPVNARKALVHAAFFGPGSHALFDAVSCNISGDVFYNGGDPIGAIREYRRGLALDQTNVNILNSLGVAYAQMNQARSAIRSFEAALAHAPDNFMALFNLGFVFLGQGDEGRAISSFAEALVMDSEHFDLLLQLGRLYCRAGRHEEALPLLEKAAALQDGKELGDVVQGAVQRYLGEVHLALGHNREAMAHLERATALNPHDAGAMSRLGQLYMTEGQGNEIALSLCRQAVELEAADPENWYRYGQVQFALDDPVGAVAALRQSLRRDRLDVKAALLLAQVYEKTGRPGPARRLLEKVARLVPGHAEASKRLRKYAASRPSAAVART